MHAGDIIPSPLDILLVIGRMLHSVTTFVQPATLGPFVANPNRMETPYLLEHEIITFFLGATAVCCKGLVRHVQSIPADRWKGISPI